jgi:hypothetical protein
MWLPMNPEAPVTATMVDANSVESAEDAIVVMVLDLRMTFGCKSSPGIGFNGEETERDMVHSEQQRREGSGWVGGGEEGKS